MDAQHGIIRLEIHNKRDASIGVRYWLATNYYLQGGTRKHKTGYYRQKIASFEGQQLNGSVVSGPPEIVGQHYTATLAVDIADIKSWALADSGYATYENAPVS